MSPHATKHACHHLDSPAFAQLNPRGNEQCVVGFRLKGGIN